VPRVLYLLFNEGYWSSDDEAPIRSDLCRLAIGLARSLHDAFPGEPEVLGLLALTLLHDARRGARLDSGRPVPLPEQDHGRWDPLAIAEATALLEQALARCVPGRGGDLGGALPGHHSRADRLDRDRRALCVARALPAHTRGPHQPGFRCRALEAPKRDSPC
jgi:RNA polymerase sigma-70 factor (ECF subfamily)